jgi:hypothetical protein
MHIGCDHIAKEIGDPNWKVKNMVYEGNKEWTFQTGTGQHQTEIDTRI